VRRALALVLLAACAPTDTGNPPLAPMLDPELISGFTMTGLKRVTVTVTGGPGAIDADHGTVLVLDFGTTAPPHRADVAADGSFSLVFDTVSDDDLRLWAEVDGQRSDPFDFVVVFDRIEPREPEVDDCVEFAPRFALDLEGASRECVVTNGCATDVMLAASLRERAGAFSIAPATATIGPNGSMPFTVTANGTLAVDALFFDVTGATLGRHVVTLHAHTN
jgi:hypothetical protein